MERPVTETRSSTLVQHPERLTRQAGFWAIVASVFGFFLYRFPPETYPFYPPCPIHQFTGLLCPGCGATRAIAALLHGHLRQALDLNALVVLLLPALAAYLVACSRSRRWYPLPGVFTALLFATTASFTVSRNLHSL